MSRVSVIYTASSGTRHYLQSSGIRIKEANFHNWEFAPAGSAALHGIRLTGFTKEPAQYETKLYFTGPISTRKAKIEALHDDFERDICNNLPGRITWGNYYIDCFIISSDTYPGSGWETVNDITIYSPFPYWTRERTYPIMVLPSVAYPINTGLKWAFDFALTINGPCTNPVIRVTNDAQDAERIYDIPATLAEGEKVILNTRDHTIYKYDTNDEKTDLYDDSDAATIFQQMPRGRVYIRRSSDDDTQYTMSLTIYDTRSEPKKA